MAWHSAISRRTEHYAGWANIIIAKYALMSSFRFVTLVSSHLHRLKSPYTPWRDRQANAKNQTSLQRASSPQSVGAVFVFEIKLFTFWLTGQAAEGKEKTNIARANFYTKTQPSGLCVCVCVAQSRKVDNTKCVGRFIH